MCFSEEPSRCCGSCALQSSAYEEVMVSNTREKKNTERLLQWALYGCERFRMSL